MSRALEGCRRPKLVAVVHAETSTGVWQPLDDIARISHDAGALFLVDAVTSLGGCPVEVDAWHIDACYSATQKCLSCPPGLAPVTFSPAAVETMQRRRRKAPSWYLDLSLIAQYWGKDRVYHHTAPISMNYALYRFEQQVRAAIAATGKVPEWLIELTAPKPNIPADLAFPAFKAAKELRVAPPQLAQDLAAAIELPADTLIDGVVATGPFLNFTLNPARLIGVTVFDGLPPDRKVRPSTQRSSGGTLTIRWRLRENRRSYYVMCSYEHTAARLYAALPPGVLLCEAAFDLNVAGVGGHPVKRMFCQ